LGVYYGYVSFGYQATTFAAGDARFQIYDR
jgi:hypothetical protein